MSKNRGTSMTRKMRRGHNVNMITGALMARKFNNKARTAGRDFQVVTMEHEHEVQGYRRVFSDHFDSVEIEVPHGRGGTKVITVVRDTFIRKTRTSRKIVHDHDEKKL